MAVLQALQAVAGLSAGRSQAKEGEEVPPVPPEVVQATLPHLKPVIRAMVASAPSHGRSSVAGPPSGRGAQIPELAWGHTARTGP